MNSSEVKQPAAGVYRGRLAPSPTGYLHVGHASTFAVAQQRAKAAGGVLVLRNEDLDDDRVRQEYKEAMLEDLRWAGFEWDEGPDIGGRFGPYNQSDRIPLYREAFEKMRKMGVTYPCVCSRKEIRAALSAPHQGEEEPIYPGTCRPVTGERHPRVEERLKKEPGLKMHWRMRVPPAAEVRFNDGHFGAQQFTAGKDFGDFVLWRQDSVPAYQLAVVVDDYLMRMTEVVRGADLLLSTARQLLIYEALEWKAPDYYHCPLVTDQDGVRLAKRHDSLSLRALRAAGKEWRNICRW